MCPAVTVLRAVLLSALITAPCLAAADGAAAQADGGACQDVRLADIGWTDVTATTALLAALLRDLGYRPQTTVLSVPVTFNSMKHGDIDVFLGNWMPAQAANRAPFVADGSVELIGAQPHRRAATRSPCPRTAMRPGCATSPTSQRFGAALGYTIYGIEPGNDGNRHVLGMLQQNTFGLGQLPSWSNRASRRMLAEVERAYRAHAAHRVPGLGSSPDESCALTCATCQAGMRSSARISAAPRSTP